MRLKPEHDSCYCCTSQKWSWDGEGEDNRCLYCQQNYDENGNYRE
jgi:hypothetical protein